jgi:hypothetical protein
LKKLNNQKSKKLQMIKNTTRSTIILILAAFLWLNFVPANAAANTVPGTFRTLSIDDYLACRSAVESVYWQQRIWPESNPNSKPALDEVLSEADVRAMVDKTLSQSLALELYWQAPITGPMLQAELERMASESRQPAVLKSLFAALDNDPTLAAECLARPVLAERLLQEAFENDERFAGLEFVEWWDDVRPETAAFKAPTVNYQLPQVSNGFGDDDSWKDTPSIPLDDINGDVEGAAVWTGSEMVFMPDFSHEAYRYNPATDYHKYFK